MVPSEPAIVTCVELAAVTVNVDELPAWIVGGFDVMLTLGAGGFPTVISMCVVVAPPQ